MKLSRTGVALAFFAALLALSVRKAAPVGDGVAAYSLPKIKPKGFNVYQGILDWAPVSSTQAVAFARNMVDGSYTYSLKSYILSKTGVASSSRTIGTGMGTPRAAASFWIEAGGGGDSAGPYGLVFVLFETYQENPHRATGSVRVAKFDASGKRTRAWRELLRIELGKDQYFSNEALFACCGPNSMGVVPSAWIGSSGASSVRNSRVYFLEASLADGGLIGRAVPLPLPEPDRVIQALASRPSWTGTSWLVPAVATVYEKGGGWDDIIGNRAMVYSVSGGATRKVVGREIARDTVLSSETYGALCLLPGPGTAGDQHLFVRHRKPIPESRRELDMFQYDYSLKRLDASGRVLKSAALKLPAPAHKLAYDPAYKFRWEWDEWSEGLARKGKVYLSQCRSIEIYKKGNGYKYEQQVNFFEINPLDGAVQHRAQAITIRNEVLFFHPLIDVFPGGSIAVVNRAYHSASPYPWDSYITRFSD